jgi:hypothetical protein
MMEGGRLTGRFCTLQLKEMWHGKDGWQEYERFLREHTSQEKDILG